MSVVTFVYYYVSDRILGTIDTIYSRAFSKSGPGYTLPISTHYIHNSSDRTHFH